MTNLSKQAKAYEKMTRAERRVAICKDVIKTIHAEKGMRISRGAYVCAGSIIATANPGRVPAVAAKAIENCRVCAKGAMMLTKLRAFNHAVCSTMEPFAECGDIDGSETVRQLKDAFSEIELEKIESAFECWSETFSEHFKYGVWGNQFDDSTDRLLAIMQNIVDHKGTFNLKAEYEIVEV